MFVGKPLYEIEELLKYPDLEDKPREWADPKAKGYTPSIYSEPRSTKEDLGAYLYRTFRPNWEQFYFDALGMADMAGAARMIKGRPEGIARKLRKLMQAEAKASAAKTVKAADIGVSEEAANFFRRLLRSTWWHGRDTPPPKGEVSTFRLSRRKGTLFGEPVGTSLSKSLEKAEEGFGPKLLRVRPVYGADPLEKILIHQWEPHAQILNDTYVETVKQMAKSDPEGIGKKLSQMEGLYDLKGAVKKKEFNELLTENLEKKGWKGLLYSPSERYSEYELKMFPGHKEDRMGSDFAYFLDDMTSKRPPEDPWGPATPLPSTQRYERMFNKQMMKDWRDIASTGKYHHLKEHYKNINLRQVAKEVMAELPEHLQSDLKMPRLKSTMTKGEAVKFLGYHVNKLANYQKGMIGASKDIHKTLDWLQMISGKSHSELFELGKVFNEGTANEGSQMIHDLYDQMKYSISISNVKIPASTQLALDTVQQYLEKGLTKKVTSSEGAMESANVLKATTHIQGITGMPHTEQIQFAKAQGMSALTDKVVEGLGTKSNIQIAPKVQGDTLSQTLAKKGMITTKSQKTILKHLDFSKLPTDMQQLADDALTYANYAFYPAQQVPPEDAAKALKNIIKHTGLEEQSIVETLKQQGGISTIVKDALYKKPPEILPGMSSLETEAYIEHHLGNLSKSMTDIVDDDELNNSIKIMKALTGEDTTTLYNAINAPTSSKINALHAKAKAKYAKLYAKPVTNKLQTDYEAAKLKLKTKGMTQAELINTIYDAQNKQQTFSGNPDFAPISPDQFESNQKYFFDNAQNDIPKAMKWLEDKFKVYTDYNQGYHTNELAAKHGLKNIKIATNLSEDEINQLVTTGDKDTILQIAENNLVNHGIAQKGKSIITHKDDIGWMKSTDWLAKKEHMQGMYDKSPETQQKLKNAIDYSLKQYELYYKGGVEYKTKHADALKTVKAATGLTTDEINHLLDLDAKVTIKDYVDLNFATPENSAKALAKDVHKKNYKKFPYGFVNNMYSKMAVASNQLKGDLKNTLTKTGQEEFKKNIDSIAAASGLDKAEVVSYIQKDQLDELMNVIKENLED